MENIVFRKASENDIEKIVDIFDEIHEEIEKGTIWIGWIKGVYPTKATVKEALCRDDLFVLEAEGVLVGTGVVNQQQVDVYRDINWKFEASDEKVKVLHTLAISPKVGRKGYGSKFIGYYEQYAKEHGCLYLRLDTNERNENARALYKKLGYEERGTLPCAFNGIENFRLVMMEKYIGE